MGDKVLDGDPPISLSLRRSARARRISLRISSLDGRVTLTVPRGLSEHEAFSFAREKENWIRKHLQARTVDVAVDYGVEVPIDGVMYKVARGSGRSVRFVAGEVQVPGRPDRVGVRLAGHLKALAKLRFAEASNRYSQALGKSYSAITLRDTRSRWGSCTTEGRLMYSWRLVMAPRPVLEYVAAHEVAHLAEMNHGPVFWGHVTELYGDYRDVRKWLRHEGGSLHRYRFG